MSPLEIVANVLYAVSVILAGRNSVHTWWTGIIGSALFVVIYFQTKLYADVTLQVFFIVTSAAGWWHWLHGRRGSALPMRHCAPLATIGFAAAGVVVTLGYGWLLHRFTDAYAPFWDSVILAFSVLGQFLLMGRRVESWWCWIIVNTVAVPLYFSRGLQVTAAFYEVYWINAIVSVVHWQKLAKKSFTTESAEDRVRDTSGRVLEPLIARGRAQAETNQTSRSTGSQH